MEKHGLAIVGLGGMGSHHARQMQKLDRVNFTGTFDILESRQAYAVEQGYHAYPSFEAVLADPAVEIVLIATPNDQHKPIALAALKAGKNVICEKPAMITSEDLLDVLAVAEEMGKKFIVHQNRRWDEGFLVMKKLYAEKTIGEVFNIESRVLGGRGIPGDWRGIKKRGGGMLYDWGVHLIDQMLQVVPGKIKKVYCITTNVTNKECDDGFKLFLTFECGTTALVEVGTCNFINMPMWYMAGDGGTAMIADWDMEGKIVKLHSWEDRDAKPIQAGSGVTKTMAPRDGNSVEELPIPRLPCDWLEYYENVFDYLEGKADVRIKNCEVLRVLRLIECALMSAKYHAAMDFE